MILAPVAPNADPNRWKNKTPTIYYALSKKNGLGFVEFDLDVKPFVGFHLQCEVLCKEFNVHDFSWFVKNDEETKINLPEPPRIIKRGTGFRKGEKICVGNHMAEVQSIGNGGEILAIRVIKRGRYFKTPHKIRDAEIELREPSVLIQNEKLRVGFYIQQASIQSHYNIRFAVLGVGNQIESEIISPSFKIKSAKPKSKRQPELSASMRSTSSHSIVSPPSSLQLSSLQTPSILEEIDEELSSIPLTQPFSSDYELRFDIDPDQLFSSASEDLSRISMDTDQLLEQRLRQCETLIRQQQAEINSLKAKVIRP